MPSSGAQTDVTVYPTEQSELNRWFRGFEEEEAVGGFAAFTGTAGQEIDLVEASDVMAEGEEKTNRDFVVVIDRAGHVLRVHRKTPSGKRVLVARGAFSELEP